MYYTVIKNLAYFSGNQKGDIETYFTENYLVNGVFVCVCVCVCVCFQKQILSSNTRVIISQFF